MAITDISISEELMTNAPSIKYRGNEGPKSPEEMQMMMVDDILDEAYEQYIYDLLEQRPDATPMSKEEFKRMVIAEGMMSKKGPVLPSDEDPINPFGPKPIGPPLPDRKMAAYGGIMGVDGRKQYGIGSFFQKYIKDPIEVAITGKTFEDLERESQARVDKEDALYGEGYEGVIDRLFKGEKKKDDKGREYREGGVQEYIIPAIGGITAGLFTKKNSDGSPGGQPTADETALMLADLKKSANILDQKQGIAAGLNFLPDVAARKFTPAEMIETYKATAANGGRIGYNQGNAVVDYESDPNYQGWKRIYETNPDAAAMNENHKQYESFYMSQQNMKAEGGRIGFSEGSSAAERYEAKIKELMDKGLSRELAEVIVDSGVSKDVYSIPEKKAEGGIMDLGGLEKDYRAEGGFVPIGKREKADDVPARLSVNEFVFTADAVRNAGGGDVDEGAKVMERVMKHLEGGGQMSRESQGMGGAREMFEVSERLSEVV